MAGTQKNKATNYHLGTLKAKLARLRNELFVEESGGGGGGSTGEGFNVARNGDARVALIGFPSVGKSTLLGALTTTESETVAYELTTLTCIPGVLQYKGSRPEPEKLVTSILREYKISSADVLAREEITVDQLVDVIQGNREYKPCLYLYNKIGTITIEEVDQLARMPHSIVGSVNKHFNIGEPHEDDLVKQMIWQYLELTRTYTKKKGKLSVNGMT
jgi:ribosome-interacting GTPase 1